ncbi:hypothetical protein P4V41_07980 [Fictibacillus nanhaiensis]|uniref:hypothetical protein n=1 Tax=Fictibacillus nanhaiensis TaxID=742169 RepID=UPI002E1C3663|nr:hypothetical protein [Fictibacillus nanhaiensis]
MFKAMKEIHLYSKVNLEDAVKACETLGLAYQIETLVQDAPKGQFFFNYNITDKHRYKIKIGELLTEENK